jgi:hypothetical protein
MSKTFITELYNDLTHTHNISSVSDAINKLNNNKINVKDDSAYVFSTSHGAYFKLKKNNYGEWDDKNVKLAWTSLHDITKRFRIKDIENGIQFINTSNWFFDKAYIKAKDGWYFLKTNKKIKDIEPTSVLWNKNNIKQIGRGIVKKNTGTNITRLYGLRNVDMITQILNKGMISWPYNKLQYNDSNDNKWYSLHI